MAAISITALSPAVGDNSKQIVCFLYGNNFTVNTTVTAILSGSLPQVTSTIASPLLISSTQLQLTIAANTLPIALYDIQVSDPANGVATLASAFRSAQPLPLFPYNLETADNVRTRVLSRMNNKYDTRQGNVPWDMISPQSAEFEKFYSRLNRIASQIFAQFMGGARLDLRAEEHGVIRKPATPSFAYVRVQASPGVILPTNMSFVTTPVANSGTLPVVFNSIETISKTVIAEQTLTVVSGDTTPSFTVSGTFTLNQWQNFYVKITDGSSYTQVRKIVSNQAATSANAQFIVSTPWDQGHTPAVGNTAVLFCGVDVQSSSNGASTNVAVGAINRLTSATTLIQSVTNYTAATGGSDIETDLNFLSRYLLTVRAPASGGTQNDYILWAKSVPGTNIGYVNIVPLWAGAGTVQVVIFNGDNTVPNSATVQSVQNYIDPAASTGLGAGKAPIGATVTVQAASTQAIDFTGTCVVASGFNPVVVKSQVQTAIQAYLNNLSIAQTVVFNVIINTIMSIPGVQDITTPQIRYSGGAYGSSNLSITATQKPLAGIVTVN